MMAMRNASFVKAIPFYSKEEVIFFTSLAECCFAFNIRYEYNLRKLIDEGGLSPDGKWFFDYPTDWEMEKLISGDIPVYYNGKRRRRQNEE